MRADEACEGLEVDEEGYVVWRGSGERLTAEEAAKRGPAVEMATRARLALGEGVEVERGEPAKRQGGRAGGGREDEGEGTGGGTFVNVQAARASLASLTGWVARVDALGGLSYYTCDAHRPTRSQLAHEIALRIKRDVHVATCTLHVM